MPNPNATRQLTQTRLMTQGLDRLPEHLLGQNLLRLPHFVWLIFACTFVPWVIGAWQILGWNVTGWAWIIPLFASIGVVAVHAGRVRFPWLLWMPWIVVLVANTFFRLGSPNAVQTCVQTFSPIAVGIAASTIRWTPDQVDRLVRALDAAFWLMMVLAVFLIPGLLSGRLLEHGYMAPQVIGSLLFVAIYAARYACGSGRHLLRTGAMFLLPILCLTRGPLGATVGAIVLTPAPLGLRKRLLVSAMAVLAVAAILMTPRFQRRMFNDGEGTLSDLRVDNVQNIHTSGRALIWQVLWDGFLEKPWSGYGVNASRTALMDKFGGVFLPHNDWLKLLYDVGIVGTACFAVCILIQLVVLVRMGARSRGGLRMLCYAAAGGFVPFALIMITDNVLLYTQFYGNLHFLMIGAVYSAWSMQRSGQSMQHADPLQFHTGPIMLGARTKAQTPSVRTRTPSPGAAEEK